VTHNARRTATFVQLAPGALSLQPDEPEVEKKARCYMCHANGPRAIRPEWESAPASVSSWDRLRLTLWNLRIKTYGRFAATAQDVAPDFRVQSSLADEPLQVAACTRCHGDGSANGLHALVARGTLRRQHYAAIDFMVGNGLMPPPGYGISEQEKREILQFTGRLTARP
jgi:cytochrome c553